MQPEVKQQRNHSAELLRAAKQEDHQKAYNEAKEILGDAKDDGVEVNLLKESGAYSWNSSGWTALHWAVYSNNLPLIELLANRFPHGCGIKTDAPWRPLLGFDSLFGFEYRKTIGLNGNQTPFNLVKTFEARKLLQVASLKVNSYTRFVTRGRCAWSVT